MFLTEIIFALRFCGRKTCSIEWSFSLFLGEFFVRWCVFATNFSFIFLFQTRIITKNKHVALGTICSRPAHTVVGPQELEIRHDLAFTIYPAVADQPLAPERVNVEVKLSTGEGEVLVEQTFINTERAATRLKYLCPLIDGATVKKFEAIILEESLRCAVFFRVSWLFCRAACFGLI